MKDQSRSKKQLINELVEMRQRIAEEDDYVHKINNLLTAISTNVSVSKMNVDDGSKAFIILEHTEQAIMKAMNLTREFTPIKYQ